MRGCGWRKIGRDGGRDTRGFLFLCSECRWLERNCFVGGGNECGSGKMNHE